MRDRSPHTLLVVALVLSAWLLQSLVLARLPFGATPDLVLVVVLACALLIGPTAGPQGGAVLGFCAGLLIDLTPPNTAALGVNALLFCLAGYSVGLAAATTGRARDLRGADRVLRVVATCGAVALGQAVLLSLFGGRVDLGRGLVLAVAEMLWAVLLAPLVLALVSALALRSHELAEGP